MHLQVRNVVELTGSKFFKKHSELTFPSLPFDSFAHLQFSNANIDNRLFRNAAIKNYQTEIGYFESMISQSEMAMETLHLLQEKSNEDPQIIIHVSHFPNEDWFDFINMRLLKRLTTKSSSFSLVGLGALGIPTTFQHIMQTTFKREMSIWVIATDRIVSPFVRVIPNLGIISDSAIGIELQLSKLIEFPIIDSVAIQCDSIQSWYNHKAPPSMESVTLGKKEIYQGWATFIQDKNKNQIDFKDHSLGSALISLR